MNVIHGDCLEVMRDMATASVDLCMASPPYECQRAYSDLEFSLRGEEWVEWAVERFMECYRVTRGLTAWVVEGQTRDYQWSATPALLMAELHKRGVKLCKPPIYARHGIPGSGGKDWLKNNYEFIICASHGKLPWSENTAMGKPCKYPPGGKMSHHGRDGRVKRRKYTPPAKANPGNIISGSVGGGRMGSHHAHGNEAPYPEWLAEFFIRSFCPPGGIVFDPFLGSGTTLAVAKRTGRDGVGIDLRLDQVELSLARIGETEFA